jgi:hypothetical protein
MNLYGHEIEIPEVEGGIITDVMILARAVNYSDEGRAQDEILIAASPGITGMIQDGMLRQASVLSDNATIEAHFPDEDD